MSTSARFVVRARGVAAALLAVAVLIATGFGSAVARQATPTPAAPGSLTSMLQLAPDLLAAPERPAQVFSYADLAAQSAVAGLPVPAGVDDPNFVPWSWAMSPLLLPDPLVNYALVADWRTLLGFDLTDLDQALDVGEPPLRFLFVRGRFDEAALRRTWASQGYRILDVDGITVASLHEDASFDVDTDLGRYAFARFNNAAILPDGTLAYSPTLDGMRAIIAVAQGRQPSLGDRVDVAALVGAIQAPLASATLVTGDSLEGTTMLGPGVLTGTPAASGDLATQVAQFSEMPPIALALLGVTPGGPVTLPGGGIATPRPDVPPARFEIALLLGNHAAAETAARVIDERLATGTSLFTLRPLTDYFSSWDVHALPDEPIAVAEITFAPDVQPRLWIQMLARRDLPFLAW
jgi:hypothetical protein